MSSLSNGIKVVDMWYAGKPSKISYMSDENRLNLMDELERDYLDKMKSDEDVVETMLFRKYG